MRSEAEWPSKALNDLVEDTGRRYLDQRDMSIKNHMLVSLDMHQISRENGRGTCGGETCRDT